MPLPNPASTPYVSLGDAADYLQIGRATAYRWARNGRLVVVRSRANRIRVSTVGLYLILHTPIPPPPGRRPRIVTLDSL